MLFTCLKYFIRKLLHITSVHDFFIFISNRKLPNQEFQSSTSLVLDRQSLFVSNWYVYNAGHK